MNTSLRWRRRRWTGETAVAELPDRAAAAGGYQQVDVRESLRRALRELTAKQRAVIMLRYFEDRTSFYAQSLRTGGWRPDGWDTSDLALDLVVDPDGARRWKDEDEYAHHRRLGLITQVEHTAVRAAREEAVALVEARGDLFADPAVRRWLPDPGWSPPSLSR